MPSEYLSLMYISAPLAYLTLMWYGPYTSPRPCFGKEIPYRPRISDGQPGRPPVWHAVAVPAACTASKLQNQPTAPLDP